MYLFRSIGRIYRRKTIYTIQFIHCLLLTDMIRRTTAGDNSCTHSCKTHMLHSTVLKNIKNKSNLPGDNLIAQDTSMDCT